MSERWDAIVVGAGPAGSALAIRLAQSGVRVLLVDRAEFPRDKLCGEFISPECWPIFEKLGVTEAVRSSHGQPIRRLRLWLPGSRSVEAELPLAPGREAFGLSRARLDHILLRRAEELGGTVAAETELVGVVRRMGAVVGVRVRPARASRRSGGTECLSAKVVIAADGRRSGVVRETGQTRVARRSTPGDVCAVKRHFRVPAALDPGDGIELHSFAGGYGGTCRVEAGVVNLCTLVPLSALRSAHGDIDRTVRTLFRGSRVARLLEVSEPIGDWKTVPEVRLERSRPEMPGVLYAGDAMGTVDPLGGEGMTMALQGAMLAARHVEQAVSSCRGCDTGLQHEYQSAWSVRFRQRVQLCRSFSWLLSRPNVAGPPLQPAVARVLLPWAFRATRGRVEGQAAAAAIPEKRP